MRPSALSSSSLSSLILLAGCASAALPAAAPPQPPAAAAIAPVQVAAAGGPIEGFADPGRRAKLAATFPALDTFLTAQQSAHNLPSLAFGVVVDGQLVYQKGLGTLDAESAVPVDADTIYRIGSITKTFTTLAILKLRDEGKLALDEPAARELPELAALKCPTRDSPPMTLRHLLTHTSGLPTLGAFSYAQSDHADIFAPSFRAAVPATLARQIASSLATSHGRCGVAGAPDVTTVSIDSPSKGAFSVACERGRFELRVGVSGDGKVVEAQVTSHDLPPTTRMRELATRVVALGEVWSETTYTEVLAPTFTREVIQSALRSSKARYGACHLAKALDGDGDHEATFALTCERGGELNMELTTDAARARVAKLRIEPAAKKGEGCGGN